MSALMESTNNPTTTTTGCDPRLSHSSVDSAIQAVLSNIKGSQSIVNKTGDSRKVPALTNYIESFAKTHGHNGVQVFTLTKKLEQTLEEEDMVANFDQFAQVASRLGEPPRSIYPYLSAGSSSAQPSTPARKPESISPEAASRACAVNTHSIMVGAQSEEFSPVLDDTGVQKLDDSDNPVMRDNKPAVCASVDALHQLTQAMFSDASGSVSESDNWAMTSGSVGYKVNGGASGPFAVSCHLPNSEALVDGWYAKTMCVHAQKLHRETGFRLYLINRKSEESVVCAETGKTEVKKIGEIKGYHAAASLRRLYKTMKWNAPQFAYDWSNSQLVEFMMDLNTGEVRRTQTWSLDSIPTGEYLCGEYEVTKSLPDGSTKTVMEYHNFQQQTNATDKTLLALWAARDVHEVS